MQPDQQSVSNLRNNHVHHHYLLREAEIRLISDLYDVDYLPLKGYDDHEQWIRVHGAKIVRQRPHPGAVHLHLELEDPWWDEDGHKFFSPLIVVPLDDPALVARWEEYQELVIEHRQLHASMRKHRVFAFQNWTAPGPGLEEWLWPSSSRRTSLE